MTLKKQYSTICNNYLERFCEQMDLCFDEPVYAWVASEPGTIACIADYYFDFHDVVKYCVDEGLNDIHELLEWYDYTLWAHEFNQAVPNFQSWHKGCPRVEPDKMKELSETRQGLVNAIEQEVDKVIEAETITDSSFDIFWEIYDKKVARGKCEKLWNKLSEKDKQACLLYIPAYKQAQQEKRFRKDPERFLRNRSWEDEIIYRNGQSDNLYDKAARILQD